MMRSIGRAMLLAMLLAGCGRFAGGVDGGGGDSGGGAMSWCQVDDPGAVEQQRRQRKLARDAIPSIPCTRPRPARERPDELVLPMPCGRRMVFRAVRMTVGDALDSERALFGDADAPDPLHRAMSGPWWGEVAGAFPARPDGSGESLYYIGKYEVTEPQARIFLNAAPDERFEDSFPACQRMREALKRVDGDWVLPATGLSWGDAMAFADRYSRWLVTREKAGDGLGSILPAHGARPGYVRLPTEAEWEFAAREARESGAGGRGHGVAPGWRGAEGDLAATAWFANGGQTPPTGSAVYYVGQKAPNRLMLFDMIGNAEEMTFDLFRPVRPDGSVAGRPGGLVARGGNATDDIARVGVGARREVEAYDENGAVAQPTLGFRLVIAAPYLVNASGRDGTEMQGNPALHAGVTRAWQARQANGTNAGDAQRGGAGAAIDRLRGRPGADPALAAELAAIRQRLDQASAEVAERERRSTQEAILAALLSAGYARERAQKIGSVDRILADHAARGELLSPADRSELGRIRTLRDQNLRERDASYAYYVTIALQLAGRPPTEVAQGAQVVADRLNRAGMVRLLRLIPPLTTQIGEARAGPPSTQRRRQWIEALIAAGSTGEQA